MRNKLYFIIYNEKRVEKQEKIDCLLLIFLRGENGISCFATEELPDEISKCRFTWILNTNFKGWIPQTVVDKSLSTGLVNFMTYLREHLNNMQQSSI